MDGQRLSEWTALAENTEDPVDRRNLESRMLRECQEPYISAAFDLQCPETWRRVLWASIQPPPSVFENPAKRSPIAPGWLREVYRGARGR